MGQWIHRMNLGFRETPLARGCAQISIQDKHRFWRGTNRRHKWIPPVSILLPSQQEPSRQVKRYGRLDVIPSTLHYVAGDVNLGVQLPERR